MANETLTIIVGAQDKASPVLKQVGTAARTEMAGVAKSSEQVGAASAKGMGELSKGAKGATGEVRGLAKETNQAAAASTTAFGKMSAAVKAHGQAIRNASIAVAAFGAATLAVAAKGLQAYRQQEQAEAKLRAAIKGTGQAIDANKLIKLAGDLQKVTTFGDEATIQMMAVLTSFNLTEDQVASLAPRILNISALMGTDLQSAAIAVGKAIQMHSASALQRFGIIIDQAAMDSGNFNDILQAIDKNTGPAAEELAKGAGAADQFKNMVGDLSELIGKALVPVLGLVLPPLKSTVDLMSKLADSKVGKAAIIIGTALGGVATVLGGIGLILPPLITGWSLLTGAYLKNAAAARTATIANTGLAAAVTGAGTAAGGASVATGVGTAARAVGGAAAGRAIAGRVAGTVAAGEGAAATRAALYGAALTRGGAGGAIAGGIARGAGALGTAARIGMGALKVGGVAGTIATGIYLGADWYANRRIAADEAKQKEIEEAQYTPEQQAFMEKWGKQRTAAVAREEFLAAGAGPTAEQLAEAQTPIAEEYWQQRTAARARFRNADIPAWADMSEVERYSWMNDFRPEQREQLKAQRSLRAAQAAGIMLRGEGESAGGVTVAGIREAGPGKVQLVIDIDGIGGAPGPVDDVVSDYNGDLAYAW